MMNIDFLLEQKGTGIVQIAPEASLSECINLLNEKRIGALLVVSEDGSVKGIISERDILKQTIPLADRWSEVKVETLMTPAERLVTAERTETIEKAMALMTERRVRHLPIIEKEKPVGIISIGDVVKGLLEKALKENKDIKEYLFVSGKY